jgi:hypothetical protein
MKRPTYTVEQLRESLARLEADPDPDATTRAQINAMRHELGEVLGVVVEGDACEICGCERWIIDGDGEGKRWLLCVGADCVNTRSIAGEEADR